MGRLPEAEAPPGPNVKKPFPILLYELFVLNWSVPPGRHLQPSLMPEGED